MAAFDLFRKPATSNALQPPSAVPLLFPAVDARQSADKDDDEFGNISSFEDMKLSPWIIKTLEGLAISKPTDVQKSCIPATLLGKNILARSKTGTGKTAAFVLPIMQALHSDMYGVYAVILTPTRELAFQINEQILAFGSQIRVKSSIVIGGVGLLKQTVDLETRPHFVVATPGRWLAILEGPEAPFLKKLKFLVLDEADRLASDEFRPVMTSILNHELMQKSESKRQMLVYSATLSSAMNDLRKIINAHSIENNIYEFNTDDNQADTTVETLDERYLLIPRHVKFCYLVFLMSKMAPEELVENSALAMSKLAAAAMRKRLQREQKHQSKLNTSKRDLIIVEEDDNQSEVDSNESDKEAPIVSESKNYEDDIFNENSKNKLDRFRQMIIFVSTCEMCELLCQTLIELGFTNDSVVNLHSGLPQPKRISNLGKFKAEVAKVLIATDVASRGLDIPKVDLVINFDLPNEKKPEDYVHRVGRTARAGRMGRVISFISQYDVNKVHAIESLTQKKMKLLQDVNEPEVLFLLTRASNAVQKAKMSIHTSERGKEGKRNKKRRRIDVSNA